MLQSRQYAPLMKLAGEVIAEAPTDETIKYQRLFGPAVRNEAFTLMNRGEWKDAAALIDAGLAMEPKMHDDYRRDLEQYKTQVQAQLQRQSS
jgi:hypothetical protein